MPIAVAAVMRLCGSSAKRFTSAVLSAMLFNPSLWCYGLKLTIGLCARVILNTRPKLDLPRVWHLGRHAIRPVFSSKRLPLFASDRNHIRRYHEDWRRSDQGGTPVIVLADAAVEQQVVPPSERTRTFYRLRSHGRLPKPEKD